MKTKLHSHLLQHDRVIPFMLGGEAYFTFKSLKTGTTFTYKVRETDRGGVYYVYILTGPNNQTDYEFFGSIYSYGLIPRFYYSQNSTINETALSVKSFSWVFNRLLQTKDIADLEVWHIGRCGKCGRPLTDPTSIEYGLGPYCRSKKAI